MLKSEIHNALKLELDKTSSLTLPAFESEELDYWFDQGVRKVIEELFISYLNNGKISKLQEELKYLITHTDTNTVTVNAISDLGEGNIYKVSLNSSDAHLDDFTIELYLQLTTRTTEDGSNPSTSWVICKRISSNDIEKYLTTPFNTPYFEQPVFYLSSSTSTTTSTFNVIVDNWTGGIGTSARISYLRYPNSLSDYTSVQEYPELPIHLMHNVIERSVFLMLKNIESERVQIEAQVINNNN